MEPDGATSTQPPQVDPAAAPPAPRSSAGPPARPGNASAGWVAALPLAIALVTANVAPERTPHAAGPAVAAPAAAAAPAPAGPAAALAAAGVGAGDTDVMVAHFIDVGQANATLLEFSCGAVLVDAGAQEAAAIPLLTGYLEEFFTRRADLERTLAAIVITHNHVDHTRALREVVEMSPPIEVVNFIENGQRGGLPEGDKDVVWLGQNRATGGRDVNVVQVDQAQVEGQEGFTSAAIDPLACDGTDPTIRILWADLAQDPGWGGDEFRDKNNHSVVVRVDFGDSSFLFTGDLEEPAIESMVELYEGSDTLDVDVYEVGHHGSHNGTTMALLDAMTPQIAILSMSRADDRRVFTGWAFGHPRQAAVDMLRDAITRRRSQPRTVHVAEAVKTFHRTTMRDAIYGTAWDGTIRIRAKADGTLRVTLSS